MVVGAVRVHLGDVRQQAVIRIGEFLEFGKICPHFVDLAAVDQTLEQTKARLQVHFGGIAGAPGGIKHAVEVTCALSLLARAQVCFDHVRTRR